MKSALVVCLVLSLVIGHSMSEEDDVGVVGDSGDSGYSGDLEYIGVGGISCYLKCYGVCKRSKPGCVLCIGRCLLGGKSSMNMNHLDNNRNYFCNLGCSTSLCTKFLTDKHSGVNDVKGCVNSCSRTCSNTMN